MTEPIFDVLAVADLLSPPSTGYLSTLDRMRGSAASTAATIPVAGEAVRHFVQFSERVRDLDDDELRELYDVSFGAVEAPLLGEAAEALRRSGCVACSRALPELQRLLAPLERARNPFAAPFKGLCCLMLACRSAGLPRAGGSNIAIQSCPLE
jgi:hypothetical protein